MSIVSAGPADAGGVCRIGMRKATNAKAELVKKFRRVMSVMVLFPLLKYEA